MRLRKANRIKTIHSSLDIEGNTISEDAVRDILEGKMVVAPMREIKEVFSDENTIVETLFTEYAGHATELAKNAANNGYDVVLSVGGDGTCNEIAKALINTKTTLGIVPMGSGNGLARHLGIPIGVNAALKSLKESNPTRIDYCSANEIPFFVTCGLGFDAQISEKFAKSKTRGGITYFMKTIEEYFAYKSEEYIIETSDFKFKEEAFIIACGNASQYGNNAYITPKASLKDGLINTTIISHINIFEVLPTAVQLFTKTINMNPAIKTFASEKLIITRKEAGIMHIDGEPIEMPQTININCHKRGLRVLKPKVQAANEFEATVFNMLATVFGIKIPKKI